MGFLNGLKEEIQAAPLEVEDRTLHVLVRIRTFEDSKCFLKQFNPICIAVEDLERYILPLGDMQGIETEDVWKLVENLAKV